MLRVYFKVSNAINVENKLLSVVRNARVCGSVLGSVR